MKKPDITQPSRSTLRTRLFTFTEREEAMMRKAIRLSKIFMAGYGKGRQPYDIDLTHFDNATQSETDGGDQCPPEQV